MAKRKGMRRRSFLGGVLGVLASAYCPLALRPDILFLVHAELIWFILGLGQHGVFRQVWSDWSVSETDVWSKEFEASDEDIRRLEESFPVRVIVED